MSETVEVRDGETVETCDIQDTYSYYGDVVAAVEGDSISGFVVIN
jgi:hypothetical protein